MYNDHDKMNNQIRLGETNIHLFHKLSDKYIY